MKGEECQEIKDHLHHGEGEMNFSCVFAVLRVPSWMKYYCSECKLFVDGPKGLTAKSHLPTAMSHELRAICQQPFWENKP